MSAPCWCSGSDSWSSLGTANHAPNDPCPVREHWLTVEDSGMGEDC